MNPEPGGNDQPENEQPQAPPEGGGGGDKPPENKPAEEKPQIQDWFLKTAGTIIGGLGTGGAMAVIGSAILWIRFKEAGIPAIQAVSAQPEREALVQGAQTSIFFVLIALGVVALLYVLDYREDESGEQSGQSSKDGNPDAGVKREIKPITKWALVLLLPLGIAWAILCTDVGLGWVIGLAVIAVILDAACIWMGLRASKNFWAMAAAVFVSIIVFAGVASYAIVQQQKFVQAVAILRGDQDSGLTGYYVAVTDDKIYFANSIGVGVTAPERKPMQQVELGEGVTYSIGPLENQADATARATAMLKRLIADREGAHPGDASLPAWVSSDAAATFDRSATAHEEVEESLCLMRYFEDGKGNELGGYWTSCAEAEALATVDDVRESLALPERFQKEYDVRVKVEVPGGTALKYVVGDAAPQCAGDPGKPCGRRYRGGGLQYWIDQPAALKPVGRECTTAKPDEQSAWTAC